MNEFSIPMALMDYIPVLLFGAAAVILIRDLYNKMGKAAFTLFAAGTVDIFCAGALKATYKLLYAAAICDFTALNSMFFPVQSIGFILAGVGIVMMLCQKPVKNVTTYSVAPVVFSGTFLFVGIMVAGLACMDFGLCVVASKVKKKGVIAILVVSFICSLCMGYLSSQDFAQAMMNWIAEGVNIIGQGTLLIGAILLDRAGLGKLTALPSKNN